MANLINLNAETGANYIGDDSTASLTFENTSSGECLKLQNAGGTGAQLSSVSCPTVAVRIDSAGGGLDITGAGADPVVKLANAAGTAPALSIISSPTTSIFVQSAKSAGEFRSGASASPVMIITKSVVGSPTVAALKLGIPSAASAPAFELTGRSIVSATSGGSISAVIRVKWNDNYYWLPLMENIGGLGA